MPGGAIAPCAHNFGPEIFLLGQVREAKITDLPDQPPSKRSAGRASHRRRGLSRVEDGRRQVERRGGDPIGWNALRSRMVVVMRRYELLHGDLLPSNPWESSRRLRVGKSTANRPWPRPVLAAVLAAATPEFRALLVGYLLSAQRGSDVTRFSPGQWDRVAGTLEVEQRKTGKRIRLHVPAGLAAAFEVTAGQHPTRLFVTPRGKPWTMANAQETMGRLLQILGLPRYTLHGLRATGPVALKMMGFENRAIRGLTGHDSDQNLEIYLDGVPDYPLARVSQEALEWAFAEILEPPRDGNTKKVAGVAGRASGRVKAAK